MTLARHRSRLSLVTVGLVAVALLGYVNAQPRQVAAWLAAQQFQRTEANLGLDPQADAQPLSILFVGSDARDGATPDVPVGQVAGRRADSVVLVVLVADRLTAIAIPRDVRVHTAAHSDAKLSGTLYFGRSATVDAVRELTGMPVHRYVEVSFAALVDLVDAVGGVDVHLDAPLGDDMVGLSLPAGTVRLDGPDALRFARARQPVASDGNAAAAPPGGNLPRMARARTLVAAVADRLGTKNPRGMLATLAAAGAAARQVTVDPQFDTQTLMRFASVLDATGAQPTWCTMPTVPETPGLSAASPFPPQHPGSMQFLQVDSAATRRMVQSITEASAETIAEAPDCAGEP